VISISDNGIGMNEAAVREAMFDREVPSSGMTRVGIGNVERRIKLNHGPEFGLQMESRPGFGTTTRIKLPILSQEDHDAPRTGG
jgi:two-component system sensor histidine kinase YesM